MLERLELEGQADRIEAEVGAVDLDYRGPADMGPDPPLDGRDPGAAPR